ncbi:MAG: N-acetylmuramoyl-L-alanine amidase family protein, partial [Desulfovibrionales bacterium]
LGTPHRLFIDPESTRLTAATSAEHPVADGILTQVRTGQFSRSQSRVVLDIQDLDTFRVFSLENPFRIVVDVYAPKDGALAAQARAKAVSDPYVLDKGSKDLAGSLVEQLGLTIKTVMIDPGHGGKDPGAVVGSLYEKTINLRMAKILGKMLSDKGFHVLYTRTTDTFIPLEERTAIANAKKADLFVSIHVNAHKSASVNGFELYYLNLARSKDAVRVAARENAVSEKKISDLQVILTDLMLNSKIKESRDLANNVSTATVSHSKRYYADLRDHGVREAPFYVLMGAKMPAILVELGYLTNARERERLKTDSYLTRMAQGLANGILAYKKQLESYASLDLPGQ